MRLHNHRKAVLPHYLQFCHESNVVIKIFRRTPRPCWDEIHLRNNHTGEREISYSVKSASSCKIRALCYTGFVFHQRLFRHKQDSSVAQKGMFTFSAACGSFVRARMPCDTLQVFIPTQVWKDNALEQGFKELTNWSKMAYEQENIKQ